MTWDFFNTAAGAASIMGLIIAAVLGVVSWRSTQATDRLIRTGKADTDRLIAEGEARTQALLVEMRASTAATLAQMHTETQQTLDRIDARAEERHRWER